MSRITHAELVGVIAGWVAERGLGDAAQVRPVTEETDLIGAGLVDSLGMVDLLLHLEEVSGTRVDLTDADLGDFGTVRGLCLLMLGNQNQPG